MVGKFYAIKSEDSIKKGTIISTVFALIVAGGCYFLGGFARLYGNVPGIVSESGTVAFDMIIPSMLGTLSQFAWGDIVVAVVIVLVLAASMSTLSSLVLTSSSTLTLDVINRKENMPEKKKLSVMRIFIAFFVIVSAVIAIVKDMFGFTFIAQMMGVSWGALAGSFLAPFLYGLYWKKTTKGAVWASFAFGIAVTVVQLLVSFGVITFSGTVLSYLFSSSIRSGVLAMAGGLILVPVVSRITPKMSDAEVEEKFAGYDKKVLVSVKETLEEK